MIFRNKLWDILYSFIVYSKWDFFKLLPGILNSGPREELRENKDKTKTKTKQTKLQTWSFFHVRQLNHMDFLQWSYQPSFCAIHTNYNLILGKMLIKAGTVFSMFHCLAIIHICYLFLVLVKWLSGKRDSFLVEGQANINQALLCESSKRCGFKEENKEYFFMGALTDFMWWWINGCLCECPSLAFPVLFSVPVYRRYSGNAVAEKLTCPVVIPTCI